MTDTHASAALRGGCAWAAGGTDVGQERANNEDALLCDPERGLFVVADGMGGHAAGEQASAAVIRTLSEQLADSLRDATAAGEDAVQALLCEALESANTAILQLGDAQPTWKGLGSTAVVAVLDEDRLFVANVGDSRAYLLRGQTHTLLTSDHSVAATLVDNGIILPEELRAHPMRNQLTMVLGSEQPLQPTCTACQLRRGDRVVLCSDGLWDMLEDLEIAQIVQFSATPWEAVNSLIAEADTAGGLDNITAIVLFR